MSGNAGDFGVYIRVINSERRNKKNGLKIDLYGNPIKIVFKD